MLSNNLKRNGFKVSLRSTLVATQPVRRITILTIVARHRQPPLLDGTLGIGLPLVDVTRQHQEVNHPLALPNNVVLHPLIPVPSLETPPVKGTLDQKVRPSNQKRHTIKTIRQFFLLS